MSTADQKPCEKGNVARIVNRLSKQDFSAVGTAVAALGARSENVPLRGNRGSQHSSGASGGTASTATIATSTMASAAASALDASDHAVVRFSYAAQLPDELDLREGDELQVLEHVEDGWARGRIVMSADAPHSRGRIGLYPTNFVSTVTATSTTQTPPAASQSRLDSSARPTDSQEDALLAPATKKDGSKSPSLTSNGGPSGPANGSIVRAENVLLPSQLKGVGGSAQRVASTLISSLADANKETTPPKPAPTQFSLLKSVAPKQFAKVLYKYEATHPDELALAEGTVVAVVSRQCDDEGWFVAEHEGRRGLFPDNFVKFLDQAPLATFQADNQQQQQNSKTSPGSVQPPSLPAKPHKFGGGGGSFAATAAPVASTRDSVTQWLSRLPPFEGNGGDPSAGPVDSNGNVGGTAALPKATENESPPLVRSATAESGGGSGTGFEPIVSAAATTVLSSNRQSMVAGLQSKLFPGGRLPAPQRPPQPQQPHNNVNNSSGKQTSPAHEQSVEPKMSNEQQQQEKLLAANSSIVRSRTKIAPAAKRPPSKVNSAAALVEGGAVPGALSVSLGSSATSSNSPSASPPIAAGTTASGANATGSKAATTTTHFSAAQSHSPSSAHPTVLGWHQSLLCPAAAPVSPVAAPPSSEWVSRAEFERHVAEWERERAESARQMAEVWAELRELKRRLGAQQLHK